MKAKDVAAQLSMIHGVLDNHLDKVAQGDTLDWHVTFDNHRSNLDLAKSAIHQSNRLRTANRGYDANHFLLQSANLLHSVTKDLQTRTTELPIDSKVTNAAVKAAKALPRS
jgi:hypothetical protein